ncbi:MAG: hypothetical protein WA890_23075 [Micromonospora sp.]
MTATTEQPEPATDAIPPFNGELFDKRCAELGVTSEVQRAALVDVSVTTLHRFRKGDMGPRLSVARRFANRLGVKVDDLWPDTREEHAA